MGMNNTPASERTHIGFFGRRNAGKSSIVNAVTGQELAVVSDVKGTTTDPVYKTMELLPLGPVMIIDTPGFDDEGMKAGDTVIIEKGILKTGINDTQTALNLGIPATGNGRRENFEHKAYTRMTNTFFEGGKDSVEDMIASIKYGFMLENATCGMEDPKNWGIQCMVNVAREIADGKFTGKVYSPIVLSGYVPELLKSITMMSDSVKLSGGGFCGKGYKEWVKVSDGGPYIKATIDL